ncbi:translation initiation inhibitor [Candidatus Caldarchaeum subterraneum]|uniref:Translation initiation inhibitor n=1 Tax=Caldiarchaeum subterraneum TaxID=311458 RepID=E6N5Y6_CALS0|nr:translation initiation inhibitor [Candidatus Caldarchaeum subterraneum]BAJ50521.1 translation initiation inhibitor [Candidatus Caldarchaeum subterraneum]
MHTIMPKKVVFTNKAPRPMGQYSQAVKAGGFLFISGQVAINPETGKIEEKDVRGQTRRILQNVKAIVESQGGSLSDVVKVTVYLSRPEDFQDMNEVYSEFFTQDPPARATVAATIPGEGALLEIDVIAYLGDR